VNARARSAAVALLFIVLTLAMTWLSIALSGWAM
jgi:hypothetical protein